MKIGFQCVTVIGKVMVLNDIVVLIFHSNVNAWWIGKCPVSHIRIHT